MEMRRKDLAVTQPEEQDRIILACDCMRLGLADGDYPYVVPVNFGYQREDGQSKFYIHSAGVGHKIELLRKNLRCGFELDTGRELHTNEAPCDFSMAYESIMGNGDIVELTAPEDKIQALQIIMDHYSGKADWEFPEKMIKATCVFCLTVREMSGRKHA